MPCDASLSHRPPRTYRRRHPSSFSSYHLRTRTVIGMSCILLCSAPERHAAYLCLQPTMRLFCSNSQKPTPLNQLIPPGPTGSTPHSRHEKTHVCAAGGRNSKMSEFLCEDNPTTVGSSAERASSRVDSMQSTNSLAVSLWEFL